MTRVAVVTGGAGAIGGSIVAALATDGLTALTLEQAGDPPVDLSDEHQVRAAARRVLDQHGRCDVLAHAAAAFRGVRHHLVTTAGRHAPLRDQ